MAHSYNDIARWEEVIEQGIKYKEDYGQAKRWPVYRDYGRGKFPGFAGSSQGILPYNLTHSMMRGMVPNVYFRNPYITVSGRNKPGLEIQSKVVEATINWILGEIGIKETFKTMVQDCYYTDRGIAKVGYDGIWSDIAKMGEGGEREARDTGIPMDAASKKGGRIEYNVNAKPGMPWVSRIIADSFIVPFGVRTLSDCPWADHVVYRELEDVKASKMYENTAGLKGTHLELTSKNSEKAKFYQELSKHADIVEIHEIRDFKKKEIKSFVPGYDKWIRRPREDVLQIEGLPFIDFTFNEDLEYYWGPSDVQIIEPQQLEVNEARTQAMKHRRIALVKFLVERKGIDPDEADKMLTEDVGPYIFTNGKPAEIVSLLQPHIPPDLVQWTDVVRSDVRELLGSGRQQLGEAPSGRRTAREMDIVNTANEIRMDERRDIVADALIKVVRKINQIIFERWTSDRIVQVVGVDAARYWVQYKGADNKEEYDYKVDVESMTPRTKSLKRREIVELIQAVGKNPRANVDYLMKMLLREYDWIDAMKVLPEAQETQNGAISQQDFQKQQKELQGDSGKLRSRAGANAEKIGSFF